MKRQPAWMRKASAKSSTQALGRLKAGAMNQTESAYEGELLVRQRAGEVVWYRFEGVKLRLADNTFYTPDFAVMLADGQLEMHEVKGHWTDDARVKIKVAAEMYPFRFIAIRRERGSWLVEAFD
ncbi:MAG: DUF1064 domain-containing protein [Porticoccaceae bacterium]|nr:DUF1064 domain-containing protein [Porticoccaceae bacterium]